MRGKQYNETYKVRLGEMRRGIIHEWLSGIGGRRFQNLFWQRCEAPGVQAK